MSFRAPLRVPVELNAGPRFFQLAYAVGDDGLELGQSGPEELDGPFALRFHLPGDPLPIICHGRLVETVVGEGDNERAERRLIRFLDLDENGRGRITAYVQERIGS